MVKKLVFVSAISALVTVTSIKTIFENISDQPIAELLQFPYIYYSIWFKRQFIEAFIDFGSKVNTM